MSNVTERLASLAGHMQRLETAPELLTLEQMCHEYVCAVLACHGGNKSRAAKVLGIDRRSLYRWLDRGAVTVPVTQAAV